MDTVTVSIVVLFVVVGIFLALYFSGVFSESEEEKKDTTTPPEKKNDTLKLQESKSSAPAKTVDKTADKTVDKTADKTAGNTVDKTAGNTVDKTAGKKTNEKSGPAAAGPKVAVLTNTAIKLQSVDDNLFLKCPPATGPTNKCTLCSEKVCGSSLPVIKIVKLTTETSSSPRISHMDTVAIRSHSSAFLDTAYTPLSGANCLVPTNPSTINSCWGSKYQIYKIEGTNMSTNVSPLDPTIYIGDKIVLRPASDATTWHPRSLVGCNPDICTNTPLNETTDVSCVGADLSVPPCSRTVFYIREYEQT